MENKKYEGLDKSFYEEAQPSITERICKAKRALAGLSLVVALTGTTLGSATRACLSNTPSESVCPITKAITSIFGYEAGLRHQAHDLERYSQNLETKQDEMAYKESITGIEYIPESTQYYAPNGGTLTTDETGKMVVEQTVSATATTVTAPDGTKQIIYTVPSGYILMGSVGVKKTEPVKVEEPASVEFEWNLYDGEEVARSYDGTWTYQDDEFVLEKSYKVK